MRADVQPFLVRFAEPVREIPRRELRYNPTIRCNELTNGVRAVAGIQDGTMITMTRETVDHSEGRSFLDEGTELTKTRESVDQCENRSFLEGTEQTRGRESVDDPDSRIFLEGTELTETKEARDATEGESSLFSLGTDKTGSGEQADPPLAELMLVL